MIDYQERINVLHDLGIFDRYKDRRPRILEIGGGYGALALAISRILKPSQYVICDLPESLIFSGLYLSMAQTKPVRLHGLDSSLTPGRRNEFCLLPNYHFQSAVSGQHFDLVINTLSMSEMSAHQVETYASMISKAIGTSGVFFEQNHDNRPFGMIYAREHIEPYFTYEKSIQPQPWITRGNARIWSN